MVLFPVDSEGRPRLSAMTVLGRLVLLSLLLLAIFVFVFFLFVQAGWQDRIGNLFWLLSAGVAFAGGAVFLSGSLWLAVLGSRFAKRLLSGR